MDFAATEPTILDETGTQTESTRSEHAASNASDARKDSQQTDVLVLNVRASPDNPISGAALLPMLLTLGFKFGDHDIFHRHVNTNGKGPILFSLTNLFKPGVFDIDNMETFSTQGVSLFMMLPIEGEAQQVFNMMHNAARKIAEEFGCKILDGNRVLLSKQSLQQYSERIRDFERRRLTR
jgi:cell division protein ZipA